MKERPDYIRLMLQVLVILVVLIRGAAAVAAAPSSQDDLPVAVSINRDEVSIGDVIASGFRYEDGTCEFGRIEVTTVIPDKDNSDDSFRWIGIKLDPDRCQAVVDAKWTGLLEHGPQDVVSPILNYVSKSVKITPEKSLPGSLNSNKGVGIFATPGTKTSEQHVFSYGYGGQSDKLTHKYGGITFHWDPYNNAFLDNRWGSCDAADWTSGLGWEWRVDACTETGLQTQGWEVWHEGKGDYHCHDLPGGLNPCGGATGYYHSLIEQEKGRGDGSSVCLFGFTGGLVLGPVQKILQGCS